MMDFPLPMSSILSPTVLTSTSGGQEFPGIGAGTMLFLSGRGTAGDGPSGWTRIAPWMRTTGGPGAGGQRAESGGSLCLLTGTLSACRLPGKIHPVPLLFSFGTCGLLDEGL
jgi:hypothetical protein